MADKKTVAELGIRVRADLANTVKDLNAADAAFKAVIKSAKELDQIQNGLKQLASLGTILSDAFAGIGNSAKSLQTLQINIRGASTEIKTTVKETQAAKSNFDALRKAGVSSLDAVSAAAQFNWKALNEDKSAADRLAFSLTDVAKAGASAFTAARADATRLTQALGASKTSIGDLRILFKDLKGTIESSTGGASASFDRLTKAGLQAGDAVGATAKFAKNALDDEKNAVERVAFALTGLEKAGVSSFQKNKSELNRMTTSLGMGAMKVQEVQREFKMLQPDIAKAVSLAQGVSPALGRAATSGDHLRAALSKAGKEMGLLKRDGQSTASWLSMLMGNPLYNSLPRAFNAARDAVVALNEEAVLLERNFRAAAAVTEGFEFDPNGMTGISKDLENLAFNLGEKLPITVQDAARALEELGMAGQTAEQALQTLPSTLQLSVAASQDLGTTADQITNIMSAFGLEASRTSEVADVLSNAFTNSNARLTDIASSMKFAAPLARASGQSFKDTAAAVAVLAQSGIKAGIAGRGIRAFLTEVLSPSAEAKKKLDALGMSFTDAAGNMLPFRDILQVLSENLHRQTELTEIFSRQSVTALISLGRDGGQALDEMRPKMDVLGTTAKIATEKMSEMDLASSRLENEFTKLAAVVGRGGLNSGMADLKNGLADSLGMVTSWVEKNPQFVETLSQMLSLAGQLAKTFAAWATHIGTILSPLAELISGLAETAQLLAAIARFDIGGMLDVGAGGLGNQTSFSVEGYAAGGLVDVPKTGQLAVLHGKEAIVPLNGGDPFVKLASILGLPGFDGGGQSGGGKASVRVQPPGVDSDARDNIFVSQLAALMAQNSGLTPDNLPLVKLAASFGMLDKAVKELIMSGNQLSKSDLEAIQQRGEFVASLDSWKAKLAESARFEQFIGDFEESMKPATDTMEAFAEAVQPSAFTTSLDDFFALNGYGSGSIKLSKSGLEKEMAQLPAQIRETLSKALSGGDFLDGGDALFDMEGSQAFQNFISGLPAADQAQILDTIASKQNDVLDAFFGFSDPLAAAAGSLHSAGEGAAQLQASMEEAALVATKEGASGGSIEAMAAATAQAFKDTIGQQLIDVGAQSTGIQVNLPAGEILKGLGAGGGKAGASGGLGAFLLPNGAFADNQADSQLGLIGDVLRRVEKGEFIDIRQIDLAGVFGGLLTPEQIRYIVDQQLAVINNRGAGTGGNIMAPQQFIQHAMEKLVQAALGVGGASSAASALMMETSNSFSNEARIASEVLDLQSGAAGLRMREEEMLRANLARAAQREAERQSRADEISMERYASEQGLAASMNSASMGFGVFGAGLSNLNSASMELHGSLQGASLGIGTFGAGFWGLGQAAATVAGELEAVTGQMGFQGTGFSSGSGSSGAAGFLGPLLNLSMGEISEIMGQNAGGSLGGSRDINVSVPVFIDGQRIAAAVGTATMSNVNNGSLGVPIQR